MGRSSKQGQTNSSPAAQCLGARSLHFEPLEQRHLLSVTLNPITGPDPGPVYDIPAGKDLYVPLNGTDTGQSISYSATSSNPNVQVSVLSGNPTLELDVSGTDSTGHAFSGTMTFQLFQNIAPQTVQGIINQVNAGLYNGASFYRMETGSTFQLIQGGIEKTSGKTDTTVLPDEFNAAAAFNTPGLLAMANAGPGTATSEFFVTGPTQPLADEPQFLNFGYTIFGQILTGQSVYNEVLNVPTTASGGIDFANTPVTITSAKMITDTQNGVLQVSEPNNFTGNATITVTATGSDSTTAQQSFNVSVVAPATSSEQGVVLNPVSNVVTTLNQAVTFQLSASDTTGGTPTFSVSGFRAVCGESVSVPLERHRPGERKFGHSHAGHRIHRDNQSRGPCRRQQQPRRRGIHSDSGRAADGRNARRTTGGQGG